MSIPIIKTEIDAVEIHGPYYEYFYPPDYEIDDNCVFTTS